MNLLLVEDDKAIQGIVPERLKAGGMNVCEMRIADNLHDACNHACGWEPDVILLDLGLPDSKPDQTSSGEVLKRLSGANRTPIVILTGYDNQAFWQQARQAGAADYLFKKAFLEKGNEAFLTHAILNAVFGRTR